MKNIQELFKSIQREDINENMSELLSNGHIDSLDIMALVTAIEKFYQKPLKAEFIKAENFESFKALEAMLKEAFSKD